MCSFYTKGISQNDIFFRIGTGISYSSIGVDKNKSLTNSILNYSFGFGSKLINTSNGFMGAEVQFSKRGYGYKIKNYFGDPINRSSLSIFYLQINPYYERNIKLIKKRKRKYKSVHMMLGGFGAWKLKSKWNYYNQNILDNSKIKEIDAGFLGGLTYRQKLNKNKEFGTSVRFLYSLTNILNHPYSKGHLRLLELSFFFGLEQRKKIKRNSRYDNVFNYNTFNLLDH